MTSISFLGLMQILCHPTEAPGEPLHQSYFFVTVTIWSVIAVICLSFRLWVSLIWHFTPAIVTVSAIVFGLSTQPLPLSTAVVYVLEALSYGSLISMSLLLSCWFLRKNHLSLQEIRFSVSRLIVATTVIAIMSTTFALFPLAKGLMVIAFENAAVSAMFFLAGRKKVAKWTLLTVFLVLLTLLLAEMNSLSISQIWWPCAITAGVFQIFTIFLWISDGLP